jgi:hypothetical protein
MPKENSDLGVQIQKKVRSINTIGKRKEGAANLGAERTRHLVLVADALVRGLCRKCKAGAPDPEGVLTLLAAQGVFTKEFLPCNDPLQHPVCTTLRTSITNAVQMGQRALVTQLLSIVTAALEGTKVTTKEMTEFFTVYAPLENMQLVKIIIGPHREYRLAFVQEECAVSTDAKGSTLVSVRMGVAHAGSAWNLTEELVEDEDEEGLPEEDAPEQDLRLADLPLGKIVAIPRKLVKSEMDARVDKHIVRLAKEHAKSQGPGAVSVMIERTLERLDIGTIEHYAKYIASDRCVQINDASKNKHTVDRIQVRNKLYEAYKSHAESLKIKPAGRTYFYDHWPSYIKDANLDETCICGTCYLSGAQTFVGLTSMLRCVSELFKDIPEVKHITDTLTDETAQVEHMYKNEFYDHTALQSPVATHCRTRNLSAPFGTRLASPCNPDIHLRDGQPPAPLPDFTPPPPRKGTKRKKDDDGWNPKCSKCQRGAAPKNRQATRCCKCPNFFHNTSTCLDGEEPLVDGEDFTCLECVNAVDAHTHNMSCVGCNLRFHIISQFQRLLQWISVSGHAKAEHVQRWMQARLRKFEAHLDKYVRHKLQDSHQAEAETEKLSKMLDAHFQLLVDYAAKRKGSHSHEMQAEGYGNPSRMSMLTGYITQNATAEDCPEVPIEALAKTKVCHTYQLLSDNINQSAEHAAQGIKRMLQMHCDKYPNRFTTASGTSDKAGDFSSILFVAAMLIADTKHTGVQYISHSHSIAGEGKGKCDGMNGLTNMALARMRQADGAGATQRTATQTADAINLAGIQGVQGEAVTVNRDVVERPEVQFTGKSLCQFNERARVEQSAHVEGKPYAFQVNMFSKIGTGKLVQAEVSPGALEGIRSAIAKPMHPTATPVTTIPSVKLDTETARRKQKKRRTDKANASRKTESDVVESRKKMREALTAEKTQAAAAKVATCPKCKMVFILPKAPPNRKYNAHISKCTGVNARVTVSELVEQNLGRAMAASSTAAKACLQDTRMITVQSEADLRKHFQLEDGAWRARPFVDAAQTALQLYVLAPPGTILLQVGDKVFTPGEQSDTTLLDEATYPVQVTVDLLEPAAPPIGFARVVPAAAVLKLEVAQEQFIVDAWRSDHKKSAALIAEEMQKDPKFQDKEEVLLLPSEVQTILNRIYSKVQKGKPVEDVAALEEDDEAQVLEEVNAVEVATEDEACEVCNSTQDDEHMLLCGDDDGTGCGKGYHIYCLTPRLKKIPEGDWLCLECKPTKGRGRA